MVLPPVIHKAWDSFKKWCKKYEAIVSVLFSVLPVIGQFVSKTIIKRVAVSLLALSAVGFVGIPNQEDFPLTAYRDQVGVPTIGPGLTEGVKMGDKITVRQGLNRLAKELKEKYEPAIHRCVKVDLYQHEYDVYTKVTWNIGPAAFCTSTMVKRLNEGDYAGACKAIKLFNKVTVKYEDPETGEMRKKKVVSRGLANLREEQYVECMRDPNAPNS
jgi:lysozyme